MATLYIAKEETYEKLESLLQGFLLDLDENNNPVLLIKLEASLLNSILAGCEIELVIRNPNISKRSCTFYIYDIPNNPFYISGDNFGKIDRVMTGFDEVAIKAGSSDKITIVLYNELSHPFYTTELAIDCDDTKFNDWLFNIFNNTKYNNLGIPIDDGYYYPEDVIKGYVIKIKNKDHSQEEKLKIIAPEYQERWRRHSSLNEEIFDYENYVGNGKHGYYQELSITNHLSNFFKPEIDFFISPKYQDGNEFTDFIIIQDRSALLIESKYIVSDKPTKRHQALKKAVDQLNKAEEIIKGKKVDLTNINLTKRLNGSENIIKICLLNNKIILSDENSKNLSKIFSKEQLPFFTSVTSFFDLVGLLKIKNEKLLLFNVIHNCRNLYKQYLLSNETILYHSVNKLGEVNEETLFI